MKELRMETISKSKVATIPSEFYLRMVGELKYYITEDENFSKDYSYGFNKYDAICIEYGERFSLIFYTHKSNSYSYDELKEIGSELASGWGGECISVVSC